MEHEVLKSKTVVQVYLTHTSEFFNPVSEVWVDLQECTELPDGTLLDPDGFEVEILN